MTNQIPDARRCAWARGDTLMRTYHDTDWGVPERDSHRLFGKLILDGFQAGLSWRTILYRRKTIEEAFCGMNPQRITKLTDRDLEGLLQNPGIIRNRAKVYAAKKNAEAFLALEADGQTFSDFIWDFVDHSPRQHQRPIGVLGPTQSFEGNAISLALKHKGFTFCGPTICYAFMQAVGLYNDHAVDCFRHKLLGG